MGFKVSFRLFSNFYIYQRKEKGKENAYNKSLSLPSVARRAVRSRAAGRPAPLPLSTTRSQCSRPACLPPHLRRLPAILVGPGREPLILKIKKTKQGDTASQGAALRSSTVVPSCVPVPRANEQIRGAAGWTDPLKPLRLSGPR